MKMDQQNNRERLIDQLEQGLISTDEANIQMVKNERFRIVYRLSQDIRKVLNSAVKRGELCHMKRDGLKPEVYYHPSFEYLAIEARNKAVNSGVRAMKSICV
jgi:hypothetical protein